MPLRSHHDRKLKVLSIATGVHASSMPLLREPLELLARQNRLEYRFFASGRVPAAVFKWAEVVIFQNTQENIDVAGLEMAEHLGRKVIFHTDDQYLLMPKDLLKTRHFHYPHRLRNYKTFLNRADLIHASTPSLARALAEHTGRPIVASEPLPASDVLCATPFHDSEDGVFRFLYAASNPNYVDLETIAAGAVRRIMAEYGSRVRFIFMGGSLAGVDPRLCDSFPYLPYAKYQEVISRLTADAALAPLGDRAFSRYKTDLKFREYGALGLAGLYSRLPIYTASVIDGQTGLLVDNDEESWHRAMKRLIDHPEEARRLGRAARAAVTGRYSMWRYADFWFRDVLEPVWSGAAPGAPRPAVGGRGLLYLRCPLIYRLRCLVDRAWRRCRRAWYDAFYLDRNPAVTALKRFCSLKPPPEK